MLLKQLGQGNVVTPFLPNELKFNVFFIASGVLVLGVLVLAHFAREFRGDAALAPGSTKPPCYAG